MKRTIIPGARTGRVRIPASKSQAHRLLICAALGEEKTEVVCDGISADIAATAKCLSALGAKIEEMETGFLVSPIKKVPEGRCDLYCGESGSTLRFLLPIVGALGAQAVFHREGRLPQRPLAPLDSVLKEHGMTLREDGDLLHCSGQLIGGNYTIAGNVSSQYISGLLMALPLLIRDSLLMVSGPLESAAYVAMTEDALQLSKLTIPKMGAMWAIPGQQRCHLPKRTVVEGDWSNTAFFLCMGALSKEGVTVEGLNLQSSQGDRGVLDVLRRFGAEVTEHGDAVTVRRGALHGVMIDAAPIVLGIGVGGSFDKVAYLAKKALLRPLDVPNPDPYYAQLEQELLTAINGLGIGPQGFGGRTTCLGLAIEQMPTHVAGLPVAVNVSCHVTRRASAEL